MKYIPHWIAFFFRGLLFFLMFNLITTFLVGAILLEEHSELSSASILYLRPSFESILYPVHLSVGNYWQDAASMRDNPNEMFLMHFLLLLPKSADSCLFLSIKFTIFPDIVLVEANSRYHSGNKNFCFH